MSVYVDDVFIPYGQMKMHHMIADTKEELHEMADKIGLKREWFQDDGRRIPHYDVSKGKRFEAICNGAFTVKTKELIERGLEHAARRVVIVKGDCIGKSKFFGENAYEGEQGDPAEAAD